MLWQTNHTPLVFDDVLWPDMTFWKLMKAAFVYQKHSHVIQEAKRRHQIKKEEDAFNEFQLNYGKNYGKADFESYQQQKKKRLAIFKIKLEEKKMNECLNRRIVLSEVDENPDENNNL